jgi:ATP adenylyltransferase
MVAPRKHSGNLDDLTPGELSDLFVHVRNVVSILRRAMNPQGFNIGMNIGQIAGAGVTDHLHFHVVPRWSGDTNFMPIVGDTTVVPEALKETYRKLLSVVNKADHER